MSMEKYEYNDSTAQSWGLMTAVFDSLPDPAAICTYEKGEITLHYKSCEFDSFLNSADPQKETVGISLLSRIHRSDRNKFSQTVKAASNGSACQETIRALTSDGGYKWYCAKACPINYENGKYFFLVLSCIDEIMQEKERTLMVEKARDIALANQNLVIWRYDASLGSIYMLTCDDETFDIYHSASNMPESIISEGQIAPESCDEFRRLYAEAAKGLSAEGRVKVFDAHLKELRWKHISFTPMFDDNGKFIYSIGCAEDIQKLVEEELRFNERMCSVSAVNKDAIGVFRFNLTQNKCFDGYSKFDKVMKMQEAGTVDGFYEYGYTQIPTEEERCVFKKDFNRASLIQAFENGRTTMECNHRSYDEKGQIVWLNTVVELAKNPATGDIEGVTYSVNITKAKTLEALISTVIDLNYDLIGIFNAEDGRILSVHENRSCSSIYNSSSKENFTDLIRGYSEYLRSNITDGDADKILDGIKIDAIKQALEVKPVHLVSFSVKDHTGRECRKYVSYAYLDDSKREICYIQHDITDVYLEQKKQNEQLSAALEEAKRANAAKSEFMSKMSHEIRTPMNAIIGISDFGCEENADSPAADYFRKIKSSAEYLLGILNDILDMSKIESNKVTLYLDSYKLEDFAENINTIIAPLMQKKNIEFRFEFHDIFADTLMADKLRINQIFINLLSNSAKFTPEKGKVDFIVSQMPSSGGKVKTIFTVRDNGIGMSEDFLEHIFEPFVQERNAGTAAVQGTGLGLPISKNLIELMGGTINVKSKLGEGTEITAEIDLEPAGQTAAGMNGDSGAYDFTGKHALVVEDHSINRILAVKVLKKVGFEVDSAANGFDGLKKFISSDCGYYDAVLMDIRMPVMDGLEAAQKIRALDRSDAKTVAILAMSANAYPEDIEKSIAAGMNGHVAKPVVPALLYAELSKQLSGGKQ